MAETRTCSSCGQVLLVTETELAAKVWTCDDCKPRPSAGAAVRLFDAPQTMPGQMSLS